MNKFCCWVGIGLLKRVMQYAENTIFAINIQTYIGLPNVDGLLSGKNKNQRKNRTKIDRNISALN